MFATNNRLKLVLASGRTRNPETRCEVSRVAVDEYSEYEFWYDGGQESVHYTITGPFKGDPQDQLVQWMIKFRASLPDLLKPPSARNPSKRQ